MAEMYNCNITIDNETSLHLKFLKADLPWGIWVQEPVKDIMPEAPPVIAFKACGRPGLPGGCEGTVYYQLGDDANKTVKIYFDVTATPFTNNTVTAEGSTRKIGATLSGFKGSGTTESCIVSVVGS